MITLRDGWFASREKRARVAARCLCARGAFRKRRELAGWRDDLEGALKRSPDDEAIRRALV